MLAIMFALPVLETTSALVVVLLALVFALMVLRNRADTTHCHGCGGLVPCEDCGGHEDHDGFTVSH